MNKKIDVIYLNGGSGHRINLGYSKQFARLNGKPILIYGLEVLNFNKKINNIYIPTQQDDLEKTYRLLEEYNIKNYKLMNGGETRQESVYNALNEIGSEYVLICESVRPFLGKELLNRVIEEDGDCVIPINRNVATVIDMYGNCYNRNVIGSVQMPQKYSTKKLSIVYYKFKEKTNLIDATDDFALIKKYEDEEESIFSDKIIFHGDYKNIKITYPLDLKIAQAIVGENFDDE